MTRVRAAVRGAGAWRRARPSMALFALLVASLLPLTVQIMWSSCGYSSCLSWPLELGSVISLVLLLFYNHGHGTDPRPLVSLSSKDGWVLQQSSQESETSLADTWHGHMPQPYVAYQGRPAEAAPYFMNNEINSFYLNVDNYKKTPTDKEQSTQMVKLRCCKKSQQSMQTFVLSVFLHAVLFSAATKGASGANPCPNLCAQLQNRGRIYDTCVYVCHDHRKPRAAQTLGPVVRHLIESNIQASSPWGPGSMQQGHGDAQGGDGRQQQEQQQQGEEVETVHGMVLWQKRRWGNAVGPCIVTHCSGLSDDKRLDCIVNHCNKRRR